MADLHVVPVGDAVDHDTSTDEGCICGPTAKPVEGTDGSIGWIAIHHSLDGRERRTAETSLIVNLDDRDLGEG
jgi:hypothetical protein